MACAHTHTQRRVYDCRHVDAAFGKQSYSKNVITDPCHYPTMLLYRRKSFKSKSGFHSPLFFSERTHAWMWLSMCIITKSIRLPAMCHGLLFVRLSFHESIICFLFDSISSYSICFVRHTSHKPQYKYAQPLNFCFKYTNSKLFYKLSSTWHSVRDFN